MRIGRMIIYTNARHGRFIAVVVILLAQATLTGCTEAGNVGVGRFLADFARSGLAAWLL